MEPNLIWLWLVAAWLVSLVVAYKTRERAGIIYGFNASHAPAIELVKMLGRVADTISACSRK